MSDTFLQLFLLLNVFLIGVLTAISVRHAYAHFRPQHHEPEKPQPRHQVVHLPPATRERLLHESETKFQAVLDRSAAELQHDLQSTTTQLNKQLTSLGSAIANEEMRRYRASLDQLREQTETAIGGAQAEISDHQKELKDRLAKKQAELEAKLAERQAELESKMNEELEIEKQRLLSQIDTKLADAVASFLMESLQHEVDLGAQNKYLLAMLEEHKEDFKREISNGSAK